MFIYLGKVGWVALLAVVAVNNTVINLDTRLQRLPIYGKAAVREGTET